ncbi:catalytic/ hydrolase isoform X4 [Iris pallida]|uniref:Catalytic/ hydrolase isoform X4 n=1 Tax=Iris pallida TaxID=29817 RepID=A0AAX6ESD9_IRIPA|nr:catalytic/ hydrolase isoform X4 [Iris pallida]
MPYCEISDSDTRIFYRTYGHGSTKVLLIIGLAATHEAWGPQIKGLARTAEPNEEEGSPAAVGPGSDGSEEEGRATGGGVEVCCFDNRGVGRSSIPTKKSDYTTTIMAKDALALLDHLGWRKAHVFGHSMGSMIACKLAAIAPDRLLSLALLNATGGGFECFPRIDSEMISLAFRFLRAKTPEERAAVDLETHYTKEYLNECVGSTTRRKILHEEYVKAISSTGMQSTCGFEGQMNACWTHKMTSKELDKIRTSGFLISVIHGRHDIIAQLCHAKRLAEKLQPAARMVELHGGHLVSHERPDEVNQALTDLIKASNSRIEPEDWSNMNGTTSGVCVMGFEHMKNIIRKPARVADYNSQGVHLRYNDDGPLKRRDEYD